MDSTFELSTRFREFAENIWLNYISRTPSMSSRNREKYVDSTERYAPVDLGVGFPDYAAAAGYIPSVLADVAISPDNTIHQYNRGFGIARLVKILAKLYSNLLNRRINPMTEVLVTCGALEAIHSAIAGLVEKGDEVILIEPLYKGYEPIVQIFGGVPRIVSLKNTGAPDPDTIQTTASWKLDPTELKNSFNERTKMIILNTPHNPTGKVFSLEELQMIANLCKKYNVVCLSDEVYEWVVYKPAKHIRIASLPGMWERTLTIGSAGKTFSVTGWKCGWIYGPDYLIRNAMIAHQNNVYCHCTEIQEALAICFEKEAARLDSPECYFHQLSQQLLEKRNTIVKILQEAGFQPTLPEGTPFLVADWTAWEKYSSISSEVDREADQKFAQWLTKHVKLWGTPLTIFSARERKVTGKYIRFCFFKKDETLKEAQDVLMKAKKTFNGYHS